MVKDFKPYETPKKIKVRRGGNQIVVEKYRGSFTKKDILEFVQKKSNSMKKDGFDGKVSIAAKFEEFGWRSGYFTDVGDSVALHDIDLYEEGASHFIPDKFAGFQIYWMKNPTKQGGCAGKRNDCLFNCIKSVLKDHMLWKFPATLKKILGIPRNDPIDISYIPQIEQKLDTFKINVTGDHTYTSTKQCNREINLTLINGHYKVNLKSTNVPIKGIAYKDKEHVLYKMSKDNKTINAIDSRKVVFIMPEEEFKQIRANPISNSKLLIPARTKDILAEYEEFIKDADLLKKESNGLINMYQTGTIVKTSKKLFNHFQQSISPEQIEQTESEWLMHASCGALIFADKYKGPAYKYDIKSHYPAIMSHKLMFFPVKEGSFNRIFDEDLKERMPYGIYRCEIEETSNPSILKQFRYNKKNHYTHIDLQTAYILKLKVRMITDNQPNQLMYKRSDLVTGRQLYGEFVDYLFNLKNKGVTKAKEILNYLWGSLGEKRTTKYIIRDDREDIYDIPVGNNIRYITPINDDDVKVEYYQYDAVYVTNYERIAPFLIARGRQRIQKVMAPYIEHVVRTHTDDLIVNKDIDIVTGDQMGDLEYKGYCPNADVWNCMTIKGEFKRQ